MGNCRCYICFGINGNILIVNYGIGSISENQEFEKKLAITPEIVKKYVSLGLEVNLSENYASHLGIKDKEYLTVGAKISKDENEILKTSDIIVQLGMLSDEKSFFLKENQILIGVLNPYNNKEKLQNLAKKKINLFSLELLPRITRSSSYGYIIISSKFSWL